MDATTELDPVPQRTWVNKLVSLFLQTPKDRKELRSMLSEAASRELIDAESLHMIEGVMNVSQMRVCDIMIPRSQISFLSLGESSMRLLTQILESGHSRFPVFSENKDDIVGILHAKDLLKHYARQQDKPFLLAEDMLRRALFVPESMRLDSLLKEFKTTRNHIAIVVDEYGSVSGLVTFEDILEEIVGDIEDEFDEVEVNYIEKLDDTRYAVNALILIEDFNTFFGTNYDDGDMDTIGGFVTHQLGYVPEQDECLTIDHLELTVSHADARHIESLIVRVLPEEVISDVDED
jgi:magnesium and cobalt transporter